MNFGHDWLSVRFATETDENLMSILEDIVGFRDTGVLRSDSLIREIHTAFRKHHKCSEQVRLVEDAATFEMARRWYNSHKSE